VKQIILTEPQNVDFFPEVFSPKCSIGSNLFGIKRLRTERERERMKEEAEKTCECVYVCVYE
jgi:hypothetical protein